MKKGSRQKLPEWVKLATAFLEDSKIDFETQKLFREQRSEGIRRRRLFFLQQSLEKSSKAAILVVGEVFRRLPESISVGSYLHGKDLRTDPVTRIINERITHLTQSYTNPKGLGHDPAANLNLKSILEDIYIFARLIDLQGGVDSRILKVISTFDKGNPLSVMAEIDDVQKRREELAMKVGGTGNILSIKFNSPESVDSFQREYAVPNLVDSLLQVILYLVLLSKLGKYEQVSRYPSEGSIPKEVLDSLGRLEIYVSKQIAYCSEFLDNSEIISLWMTLIPQRGVGNERPVRL